MEGLQEESKALGQFAYCIFLMKKLCQLFLIHCSIFCRRWAETHAVHDFENIEGYCFQDAGERDNIVTGYTGMCNN